MVYFKELERFANPLRAFTYKMHGYDSVVGPLRGVYSTGSGNVKPRGHSLLVSDRPNYVTILALGKLFDIDFLSATRNLTYLAI